MPTHPCLPLALKGTPQLPQEGACISDTVILTGVQTESAWALLLSLVTEKGKRKDLLSYKFWEGGLYMALALGERSSLPHQKIERLSIPLAQVGEGE